MSRPRLERATPGAVTGCQYVLEMAITRPEELVSPGGAFPGYAVPSRHVPKQLVRERQVASSLALQMALYYNAFYSALHAFIAILGIRYKVGPAGRRVASRR